MTKKIIALLIGLIAILAAVVLLKRNNPKENHITIGILQTASFPPLDDSMKGFISEIKKELGDNVTVIEQNAQGSIIQAQAIAASFKANKSISGYFAIATPAVQALKSEVKRRPITFAAVTDPIGLHLRDEGTNITGASDMADIEKQISILREIMPKLKKVSLLYNPGETNSVLLVKQMKMTLDKYGIAYQDNGANSQADVAAAAQHAAQNSELILIPTDNTIASAFPIVRQIADKANIPVVTTWTGESEGPLMQFGVDYTQSGVQAAQLMKKILIDGINPKDLPVVSPSSSILISSKVVERLGLVIPESIKDSVSLM
ncbi:ABC transporter substrate-binding protein [Fluviispira vulneris]|uniref:ABC transporter substrate-binding protein n=1 Tax=Fluviispira vulneris TaxID=2763012 RepID=UPI001649323C|nr:ABC transporter substrate-binding protein [Fluviispira vulneris]